MIVKKYLRPLKDKQIDTLVLGCTHYPLLKQVIQEKAGKRIKIVDPSREVAEKVASFVREKAVTGPNDLEIRHEFFVSDLTPHTSEIVRRFLGKKVELLKANLYG